MEFPLERYDNATFTNKGGKVNKQPTTLITAGSDSRKRDIHGLLDQKL
jgi:hypothetical protein